MNLAAAVSAEGGGKPTPCPNTAWSDAVEPAGLLSVKLFGAVGDRSFDSAPAVRAAINASAMVSRA